jgi:hypothetical protein
LVLEITHKAWRLQSEASEHLDEEAVGVAMAFTSVFSLAD